MNRPERLLKYTPSLKFLENSMFRFSQPEALNDAYDALARQSVNEYAPEDFEAAKAHALRSGVHGVSREKLALFLSPFGHRTGEKSFPGLWPLHQPTLRSEPFHTLDEYDRAIAKRAVELAYDLANRMIGVFCLSESRHETMWATVYADDHRGVCVTFDPHHSFFAENRPGRMLYSDDPIQITINGGLVRFGGHTISKEGILRGELECLPREIFLRKETKWKFEEEWRIIKPLSNAEEIAGNDCEGRPVHLFSVPTQAIAGITFGWRSNDASIQSALQVIDNDARWKHLWVRRRRRGPTGVTEEVVRDHKA